MTKVQKKSNSKSESITDKDSKPVESNPDVSINNETSESIDSLNVFTAEQYAVAIYDLQRMVANGNTSSALTGLMQLPSWQPEIHPLH